MLTDKKSSIFNIIVFLYTFGCIADLRGFSIASLAMWCVWLFVYKERLQLKECLRETLIKNTLLFLFWFIGTYALANLLTGSYFGLLEALHYVERACTCVFFLFMTYKRSNIRLGVYWGIALGIIVMCIPILKDIYLQYPVIRDLGYMGNRNKVGAWTILVLPMLLAGVKEYSSVGWRLLVSGTAICMVLATLVMCGCRGALLAGVLMLLVAAFFSNDKKIRYSCLGALAIGCIAVGTIYYFGKMRASHGDMVRVYLLQSGWLMFMDYPWLGVGNGYWHYYMTNFYSTPYSNLRDLTSPHNIILEYLNQVGILGASGLFAMIIGQICCLANKMNDLQQARGYAVAMLVCIVGMLAHGMVDLAPTNKFYMVLYGFYWAVVVHEIMEEEGYAN